MTRDLSDYHAQIARKRVSFEPRGFTKIPALNSAMFPHQQAVTGFALEAGCSALFLDTGLGKALASDWPVATPQGWRPIGDLRVGDAVFVPDGGITGVTGVFPQGERDLYRVTFSDGAATVCDLGHLWTVNTKLRRSRGLPWRTFTLRQIVQEGLKDGQGWRHFIPVAEPICYVPATLPLEPYTLGALIGDACFRGDSVLITTDREVVEALELPEGVKAKYVCNEGKAETYRLGSSGGSNALIAALRLLGLMDGRAEHKFLPPAYLTGSIPQRVALLAGLLDTDGHVRPGDGNIEWGSVSSALAHDMATLIRSLGGTASIRLKPRPAYVHNGERRIGQPYYRLSVRLPPALGNPFTLTRKAENWRPFEKYMPVRAIAKVEAIGRGDATCIKVDAEDGLFVVKDYVVTHNTFAALEWGRVIVEHTNKPVLMLAPLACSKQHEGEANKRSIDAKAIIEAAQVTGPRVYVTNYDRLHKFDLGQFSGIILDESSILKNFTGKTTRALTDGFAQTPYRLCCTATPAPNDHMELGQHAAFLGIMHSSEMLSRWFITDQALMGRYRLKSPAVRPFWDWVASWARAISKPSDLGFSDDGFILPALNLQRHVIKADVSLDRGEEKDGQQRLIRLPQTSATSIHQEKRLTTDQRADRIAERVFAEASEPWVIWCDTDYEAKALQARLPDAVEVSGSMTLLQKERRLGDFANGNVRHLITKPSVAGYGLNWQHCARQGFIGLSFSYESFYQAVRRSWRFGQARPVDVHVACADTEEAIWNTISRKAGDHDKMKVEMIAAMQRAAVSHRTLEAYAPSKAAKFPEFLKEMIDA